MSTTSLGRLSGMVVIHDLHGPGVITSEGNNLTIEIGASRNVPCQSYQNFVVQQVVNRLVDLDEITFKAPADSILDSSSWHKAPSMEELNILVQSIEKMSSNITLPTGIPSYSAEEKEELKQKYTSFLRAQVPSRTGIVSVIYQIVNCVDYQLSHYLLRGNESQKEYNSRIVRLQEGLGNNAWSDIVLPESPDAGIERVIDCITTITELLSTKTGVYTDTVSSIRDVLQVIENRVSTFSKIIQAFNMKR